PRLSQLREWRTRRIVEHDGPIRQKISPLADARRHPQHRVAPEPRTDRPPAANRGTLDQPWHRHDNVRPRERTPERHQRRRTRAVRAEWDVPRPRHHLAVLTTEAKELRGHIRLQIARFRIACDRHGKIASNVSIRKKTRQRLTPFGEIHRLTI